MVQYSKQKKARVLECPQKVGPYWGTVVLGAFVIIYQ